MSLCGEIENIEFEIKQLLKTLEDKQAYLLRLKQIESDKEENCECGLTEDGTWSEEVFDRYGCSCEEND